MASNSILQLIKSKKYRLTKVRLLLIELFSDQCRPYAFNEIMDLTLAKIGKTSKTTIYRELDFLDNEGIIHKIFLGGKDFVYERALDNHHHHLVCLECKKVKHLHLDRACQMITDSIKNNNDFEMTCHSLEVYGRCQQCQEQT